MKPKRKIKRIALYEEPLAYIYCETCEREFRVIPEFDDELTCPYCGSSQLADDYEDIEFEWINEKGKVIFPRKNEEK